MPYRKSHRRSVKKNGHKQTIVVKQARVKKPKTTKKKTKKK